MTVREKTLPETVHTGQSATGRGGTVHSGWYLLAFEHELPGGITPVQIGARRLVATREGDRIRVFDGTCPHRGAHLGYGGVLDGDCVVCPFHGKRIALGDTGRRWSVAEHRVLLGAGAVFVRLSDDPADDRGFEQAIKEAATTHRFVAAVVEPVAAPPELVVENAFDMDHFAAVHQVPRVTGTNVVPDDSGAMAIEGAFWTMGVPWVSAAARDEARREAERNGGVRFDHTFRFYARAFSPALVVTEIGPPGAVNMVITGALPTAGGCVTRVAVGAQPAQEGQLDRMVEGARKALAQDVVVWDHLDPTAPVRLDARDQPVLAYRDFCAGFGAAR